MDKILTSTLAEQLYPSSMKLYDQHEGASPLIACWVSTDKRLVAFACSGLDTELYVWDPTHKNWDDWDIDEDHSDLKHVMKFVRKWHRTNKHKLVPDTDSMDFMFRVKKP